MDLQIVRKRLNRPLTYAEKVSKQASPAKVVGLA